MVLIMKEQLAAGVAFLARTQQLDGSFLSYSSPSRWEFHPEKTYQTIFGSALTLDCLCEVEKAKEIDGIKEKLAEFLLQQKSEDWSFNYWVRESPTTQTKPYPDDLDDTFCALAALMRHDKKLIDGAALAKIVNLLTAVEHDEGGPYRTWLLPATADQAWLDVDLAVNSNVGYFLSLHEVDLPKVEALIESAITDQQYHSPYYPSEYPIIYFISRWYRGEKLKDLRRHILKTEYAAGTWGNPLQTALAVVSLFNLGAQAGEIKPAVQYLRRKQSADGSWPAAAFCLDPAIDKQPYYAGSAALTTAFCLEALAKYEHHSKASSSAASLAKTTVAKKGLADKQELGVRHTAGSRGSPASKSMAEKVEAIVRARFDQLDQDLREAALGRLTAMITTDKDQQIRLLPYAFRQALGDLSKQVPDELVAQFGAANLYGWIAYTIYDDFLDEEGKVQRLSVANVCLRELTTIYLTAVPNQPSLPDRQAGWPGWFHEVMDRLEAANAWEVQYCRADISSSAWLIPLWQTPEALPEYGDLSRLAERSLGHTLGPAAILFGLGYDGGSVEVQGLMNFFEHYLIARQLNDDAHDWEADLRRGQINAVGAELLRHFEKEEKSLKGVEASFKKLQEFFWGDQVVTVCKKILTHTQAARQALAQATILVDRSPLEQLLTPVEQSAQEALTKRKQTLEFLEAYQPAVEVSNQMKS